MHIIPNGQNMQFLVPTKIIPVADILHPPKEDEALEAMTPPTAPKPTKQKTMKRLPKDIAPGLNRKQRMMHLAKMKHEMKEKAAAAAEAEMKRQKKESTNG